METAEKVSQLFLQISDGVDGLSDRVPFLDWLSCSPSERQLEFPLGDVDHKSIDSVDVVSKHSLEMLIVV